MLMQASVRHRANTLISHLVAELAVGEIQVVSVEVHWRFHERDHVVVYD